MTTETAIEMSSLTTTPPTQVKKAFCQLQDNTLISPAAPPIIVIGPGGEHHIGFNASVCRPPHFQSATANSRDIAQAEQTRVLPSRRKKTLRSATLRAVQPVTGHQVAGARRLRTGYLLHAQPEYVADGRLSCTRWEPLLFFLVAACHLLFVILHLTHGSGPASIPSDINLEINAHNMGTVPTTATMEVYNIWTIVLTLFGVAAVHVQYPLFFNVFITVSSVHLMIAMTQITVFSLGVRLIPHCLLIFVSILHREKLTYSMVTLDHVY